MKETSLYKFGNSQFNVTNTYSDNGVDLSTLIKEIISNETEEICD